MLMLVVMANAVNSFLFLEKVSESEEAVTEFITTLVVIIRAAIALATCCSKFKTKRVRAYLITRVVLDVLIFVFSVVMVSI